jgi:predicted MFS family arabinose efflux permease
MSLLVAGTVLVTGAYMGTFSYISPLLTDRTGVSVQAVPLVLIAFGIGAIVGTNVAGRLADRFPFGTFIAAAGGVAVVLLLLVPLSTGIVTTVILVILLGIVGMAVPPVATGLAVRFAPAAPAVAAAVAVAAFNAGTALSTWIGGAALDTPLGATAPAVLGIGMAAIGIIPLILLRARTAHARP